MPNLGWWLALGPMFWAGENFTGGGGGGGGSEPPILFLEGLRKGAPRLRIQHVASNDFKRRGGGAVHVHKGHPPFWSPEILDIFAGTL